MTIQHTYQHALISLSAEIVLQVPQSTHGLAVADGAPNPPRAFQAPGASPDVGSWSNSYVNQKSLLPWPARLGGDGVHMIMGTQVAINQ